MLVQRLLVERCSMAPLVSGDPLGALAGAIRFSKADRANFGAAPVYGALLHGGPRSRRLARCAGRNGLWMASLAVKHSGAATRVASKCGCNAAWCWLGGNTSVRPQTALDYTVMSCLACPCIPIFVRRPEGSSATMTEPAWWSRPLTGCGPLVDDVCLQLPHHSRHCPGCAGHACCQDAGCRRRAGMQAAQPSQLVVGTVA